MFKWIEDLLHRHDFYVAMTEVGYEGQYGFIVNDHYLKNTQTKLYLICNNCGVVKTKVLEGRKWAEYYKEGDKYNEK